MHPVQAKRLSLGMSIADLSGLTGLSASTIYRIEGPDNPHKVNETVAAILAEGLGCETKDLFRSTELSDLGRHALANGPYTTVLTRARTEVCPDCWIELPSSGICDCAA